MLITIGTIARSLVHMFAPDGGAHSIATIPLDSFTANGEDAVIFGIRTLGFIPIVGIIYGVVLWRYQALIPSMYLLIILEYGMRIVIGAIKPIKISGTAPGLSAITSSSH